MPERFWRSLSAAPHRLFFLSGALQLLLTMAWWSVDLAGRYNGWLPVFSWTIPAGRAHPFLMVFALYTLFFFGFVMTAGPRWLNVAPPSHARYLTIWGSMSAGVLIFYLGLAGGVALIFLALVLLAGGLAAGLRWWLGAIATSPAVDRWHARLIAVALALGVLGIATFGIAVSLEEAAWYTASFILGLWGLVLPVFTTVCHRMVPFFSAGVLMNYDPWRPRWLLFALVGGQFAHGAIALAGAPAWTWLADLPLAVLGFLVTWRWQLRRSFAVPLLAMLHVGFAWFGLALLLSGVNSLSLLLRGDAWLGLAPQHALGIGFASSLVLAMVSRVSLGHSGRPLMAGALVWALFWLLQAVVVLRLLGEWLPGVAGPTYLLASLLWLVCFGVWAAKFAPIYVQPRIDGQAG